MYSQFPEGQPTRGMADIRARQPFPGYYPNKLPEGPAYGGMVAPPRHPLPYPGKPEAMAAHDGMYAAGWNPSLPVQGYGGKPGLGKPDYPYMTQQPDMYGRQSAHGYPDPHAMAAYQGGVPPGYSHPQQFPSSYPYGSPMPPMMVDRGGPGGGRVVDGYGDGMHPGAQSGSPGMGAYPMNDPWRRSTNRVWRTDAPPQAPPPAPDGYTPNAAPPMPSSGPSTLSTQVAHFSHPNQAGNMAALSPQPLTPSSSTELQKQSSVSSIKEALLAGTQGAHSQPPASLSPSINDSGASLSTQQSMNQRSSGFPYNSPRLPDLRDSLGQGSPLTPQPALPRTPDPSTPRAVGVSSPALPPPVVLDHQDSSDGDNSQPTRPNDTRSFAKSPLGSFPQTDSNPPSARGIEHRKDMNLLDAHLVRHNSLKSPSGSSMAASPSCDGVHHQENNEGAVQGSREGSPLSPRRTGKGRSPVMSPVERTHSSLVNQYSLSDEPGRKEFLDALFNHLEREGIPLLRLPTVCKAQLDMYKIFTSVQRLGGFCHVVEKRLWKDVLRSFNPSATNPSSASLRTVQEYYVKMLLPYECVISNTNIRDCLVQYETSRRVSTESAPSPSSHNSGKDHNQSDQTDQFRAQTDRVNCNTTPGLGKRGEEAGLTDQNGHFGGFPNSQEKPASQLTALLDHGRPASGEGGMLGRHQDGLMGFSEDSQGSLDSMTSSQPLPDISVQDAESVLGIPTSNAGLAGTPSAQTASSPSYPSYQGQGGREWPPDYTPNIELPPGGPEMMMGRPTYPSAHPMDMPGYPPYHPYSHRPEFPDYRQSMMYRPYPGVMGVPPGHMPMHEYNNPYQGGGMMGMMRPRMDGPSEMGYPPAPPPHGPSAGDWHWYQQQQQQRIRMASQHPLQRMMYQQQQQHHLPSASSSPRPPPQSFNPQIEYHQQRARNAEALRSQWEEQRAMKLAAAAAAAAKTEMRELKQEKPDAEGRLPAPGTEGAAGSKRPTLEWSGCVEGTKPQLVKRRRLTCDHCGHVEPWRVMMCLKSGLPADSTWALDTLNILLHDDRTVGFFYLKHHHSLLNTLVDHFQVCLSRIFGHNLFKTLPKYMPEMDGSEHVDPGEEKTNESISSEVMYELLSTTDHTIMSEAKNGTKNGEKCQRCRQLPPMASVYKRTEQDVRLGRRDDVSHVLTSCSMFDNGLNDKLPPDHPMATTERKTTGKSQKVQRVDETPINVLTSRDVFTERMLIDLRTPKRLMARSPIQKYFMSLPTRPHEQPHHDLFKSQTVENKDGPSQPESNVTPLSPKDDRLHEENEVFRKESLPLWSTSAEREFLQRRCLCICNILRSLSFIPGNDYEFSQHSGVLLILGSLLMLHHTHLLRDERKRPMTVYQDEGSLDDAPPPSIQEEFWWWECLEILRENTLVVLANIAGQLDLSIFPEAVSYPIVCGLLHWLVCPSTQATDPLPDSAVVFYLSPQRLVVETLAKISISEVNVDYILATPPLTRLDMVYAQVVEFIGHKRHPAVRQFALVLLSNLAQGGEAASRMVGQQKMVIPLLVECLEVSEQAVITSRGKLLGGYNPDDPNSLSVAMLRRAAITLHCLAKVPINRVSFLPHRDRLLHVALSEFLDPSVTSILSDVLFELGKL